ncbi:MAG: alanine racemase [Spirochaetes bacterium]|nr:alanine racemase [Spirochaetota bacterium]
MAEREINDGPYPELRIRRSALAHNLAQFRKLAPRSRILLPVKANAYGCGLETLFPFFNAENVDLLGVANPNEAVQLRKLGWQKPILNLGGFFRESVRHLFDYAITPSITDLWQVAALQQAAHEPCSVHLKLDLGMGRIGILEREIPELVRALKAAPQLSVAGIFTHFPHSGPEARANTLAQNERFQNAAQQILTTLNIAREDILLHAANSYSAVFFPETHHDVIRPGILFYGYYQSEADRIAFNGRFDLQPCLELLATPISVRTLARDSAVSYSSLYHVAAESERIAVLPLGYADGVPRALSNRISFGNHPLRGRVTMDQIMVGNATGNEPIRLLGDGVPSLETWGDMSESFSYEVMAHLGNRLRRVLVD